MHADIIHSWSDARIGSSAEEFDGALRIFSTLHVVQSDLYSCRSPVWAPGL